MQQMTKRPCRPRCRMQQHSVQCADNLDQVLVHVRVEDGQEGRKLAERASQQVRRHIHRRSQFARDGQVR